MWWAENCAHIKLVVGVNCRIVHVVSELEDSTPCGEHTITVLLIGHHNA